MPANHRVAVELFSQGEAVSRAHATQQYARRLGGKNYETIGGTMSTFASRSSKKSGNPYRQAGLIAAIAAALGVSNATFAAEFTVSSVAALVKAVNDANADATSSHVITLQKGTYVLPVPEGLPAPADACLAGTPEFETDGWAGLPVIKSRITIKAGAGLSPSDVVITRVISALDGQNRETQPYRLIRVDQTGRLTLDGLTLERGGADSGMLRHACGAGGAIFSRGVVEVNNVRFVNNRAKAGGGAIYSRGPVSKLTVSNSVFENNEVWGKWSPGGAIVSRVGDVIINRTTFRNNKADGGAGGVKNFGGLMNISNASFIGNKAKWGGALENNLGRINVLNSTFTGNEASDLAGAITSYADTQQTWSRRWNQGIIVMVNSTVVGNKSGYVDGEGKKHGHGGGGILINKGGLLMVNSIVAGNSAIINREFHGGQDCGVFPLYHKQPVYIITAGTNIIGDVGGCQYDAKSVVPTPPPEYDGPRPVLMAFDASSKLLTVPAGRTAADVGVGMLMDKGQPGAIHMPLMASSDAINRGQATIAINRNLGSIFGPGNLIVDVDASLDAWGEGIKGGARDLGAVEFTQSVEATTALSEFHLPAYISQDVNTTDSIKLPIEAEDEPQNGVVEVAYNFADEGPSNDLNKDVSVEDNLNTDTNTPPAAPAPEAETVELSGSSSGGGGGAISLGLLALPLIALARRRRSIKR